jgi:hypothetical protein
VYCYCFHTLHDVHINRTECCRDDYSALVFVSPRCGIVQSAYDGSLYWYGAAMVMRNSHRILMICSRGERCIQWANARSNRPTLVWGSHHVSLLRLLLFLFCHLCCCGWKAILFVHQPSSTSHQLQPLLSLPLPCNIRFEALSTQDIFSFWPQTSKVTSQNCLRPFHTNEVWYVCYAFVVLCQC